MTRLYPFFMLIKDSENYRFSTFLRISIWKLSLWKIRCFKIDFFLSTHQFHTEPLSWTHQFNTRNSAPKISQFKTEIPQFNTKNPSVQHTPQFNTKTPSVQHQEPLSSTHLNWGVCGNKGCVELRGFWCGTEGVSGAVKEWPFCVELRGCGTEEDPIFFVKSVILWYFGSWIITFDYSIDF